MIGYPPAWTSEMSGLFYFDEFMRILMATKYRTFMILPDWETLARYYWEVYICRLPYNID